MAEDYIPSLVPQKVEEFPRYLKEEFERLSATLINSPARCVEFLNVAPKKPREGMLYGADGTNWNPGAGKGVYCYIGTAWTKL